ncbi:MAG: T9SS type A sorting domain-containing protein [Ignavibacteriales bacterium]|nr:T9SS type A sorting domain-containing protein [Ignavibacteriales bacterium]
MKKALLVLLVSTAVGFTIFTYQHNDPITNNMEFVLSTGNEPGPDQRPDEWAYIKKTYPYYNADSDVYVRALEQAQQLKKESIANRLSKGVSAVQWEFAGPTNIGGRVVDLEFDPNNPSIIYAGFSTGGIFKSFDGGNSWQPIFDDQAVLTIGDIAIDPNNTNIIYVGTGEANGGHNNFPGGGVFKSTDAGATWIFLGLEGTTSIGRIVINPQNSNILYLASVGSYFAPNPERGIYKSIDAGLTWNHSLFVSDTTGFVDLIIDPNNPDRLMATAWERVRRPNASHLFGPSSGIYKTNDGGSSWNKITASSLPNPNIQNVGRIGLAIHENDPNIVYSLFTDGSNIISLYRSNDFGISWTNVDTDNELSGGTAAFSWYFGQVRVHPTNPNIVYVMDVAFMRSTDGGNNWPIIYGYGGPSELHVDHHAMAFNPLDPNFIINGNDGGINISTNGGQTFSQPKNIPATQFYEIGLDYNTPEKLYGGTQDNGTNRTPDGSVDNWENIWGGDGFYVVVDYNNSNIIYAESQNGGLVKSTDGGFGWSDGTNGINGSEPTNWSTPVVMDPNSSNILYYGTHSLYRTTNSAVSWAKISPQLTDWVTGRRLGTITTIAAAPTNSNVIFVGTDDAHVWVSSNNGANWNDVSAGLPERWVTRVVVDPSDENIVYVTFSGLKWRDPQPHVYRSTNKGANWIDISGNLPDAPVNAFAVDNNFSNRLYLGSDVGMYVSFDTGQSWEVLGEGLPILPIGDIKIHPAENFLVAGTYGRSMYKIDLNLLTNVDNDQPQIVTKFTLSQNYPNPFNPTTKISWQAPISGHQTIKVYDITGKEIVTLVDEYKSAGKHEINFDASFLSSGVYLYKLNAENYSETRKMVVLK